MSSGGGLRHVPSAPPSLRSPSSCAYPTSGGSSSSSSSSSITAKATSVLGSAPYPCRPDQVADNFTFPAASSTPAPEVSSEPLSNPDVTDDACSAAAPGGDVVAFELEVSRHSRTATARLAAFWVMVRIAVLAATLAVVIAADVAFALHLFARHWTT